MALVSASPAVVWQPGIPAAPRWRRLRPKSLALPASVAFLPHYGVPLGVLLQSADLAGRDGVQTDEALIHSGAMPPELFYRLLARHLNVPFIDTYVPLAVHACRALCSQSGIAPLAPNRAGLGYVMAPRGAGLAALLARAPRAPGCAAEFAVTTPGHLTRLALVSQSHRIACEASGQLLAERPDLCAFGGPGKGQKHVAASAAALAIAGIAAAPTPGFLVLGGLFGALFAGTVMLRLWALGASLADRRPAPPPLGDHDLPVYSVLLPVYREPNVVGKLLGAVSAFDYPRAKLDVKLLVEAGDCQTLAALRGKTLPSFCEVIIAPPGAPQTKPRALNIALPFCRGALVVIYDAEDEPDPGQLRLAAATFAQAPESLVCLQGRLHIDNAGDSWLTAMFGMEYAALFDVTNPGFAALGQQFPLGGTSNHFRIGPLRQICGWDPWNVTEDADLGVRLARFRYSIGVIDSTTLEEAPARLRAWRLQRQRWLKGWMQTLVTHTRNPRALAREAGAGRAAAALTLIAGTVFGALLGPPLFWLTLYQAWAGDLLAPATLPRAAASLAALTLLGLGAISCVWPLLLGIKRRRMWYLAKYLPLLPLYYFMTTVACWGALLELFRNPYRWNKTEHGLARTSRRKTEHAQALSSVAAAPKNLVEG